MLLGHIFRRVPAGEIKPDREALAERIAALSQPKVPDASRTPSNVVTLPRIEQGSVVSE